MSSYNKVIMMGNLTRDPQLSYLPSQTAITEFGLAMNRKWTKDDQEQDDVCFVECKAFGKLAENINKFFTKGRPILIEGRLAFDQWVALDGTKRNKHYIVVSNFTFVDSKQDAGSAPQEQPNTPTGGAPPCDDIPF